MKHAAELSTLHPVGTDYLDGAPGFSPVAEGFDAFWYTWAGINRGTGILHPEEAC